MEIRYQNNCSVALFFLVRFSVRVCFHIRHLRENIISDNLPVVDASSINSAVKIGDSRRGIYNVSVIELHPALRCEHDCCQRHDYNRPCTIMSLLVSSQKEQIFVKSCESMCACLPAAVPASTAAKADPAMLLECIFPGVNREDTHVANPFQVLNSFRAFPPKVFPCSTQL
jgi:hypothetical protein